jgi:hypothetical protein
MSEGYQRYYATTASPGVWIQSSGNQAGNCQIEVRPQRPYEMSTNEAFFHGIGVLVTAVLFVATVLVLCWWLVGAITKTVKAAAAEWDAEHPVPRRRR